MSEPKAKFNDAHQRISEPTEPEDPGILEERSGRSIRTQTTWGQAPSFRRRADFERPRNYKDSLWEDDSHPSDDSQVT